MARKNRCAIYTRKSSEEGLDQEFNSLQAQREACEAYIKSLTGEGWGAVETAYDDGGLSGGTMERPALQRLLADIQGGSVDVVVVYKIDRLTRSLSDFVKMVEIFDTKKVSFVSVTQQFNTTTSMGRLTLNVLLSFAQFEREVTGERIRDKIAASKKKGMWMGGFVPLGYDTVSQKLIVNDGEAKTVQTLFRLYAQHRSVRKVKEAADQMKLRTKARRGSGGRMNGGLPFSRGHIYRILQNPIYLGEIRHRSNSYPAEHKAIISRELWNQVQGTLEQNQHARRNGTNSKSSSLLSGLLFDMEGTGYTPSHALKSGKRYRYYVQRHSVVPGGEDGVALRRIPAYEIETVVIGALTKLFAQTDRLSAAIDLQGCPPAVIKTALRAAETHQRDLGDPESVRLRETVRLILYRVILDANRVSIEVRKAGLEKLLGMESRPGNLEIHLIHVPVKLRTRGPQLKLVLERKEETSKRKPDPALVKTVVRAHDWLERLLSGKAGSVSEIARVEGVTASYVTRVMRLAFLAPEITGAILDGSHPAHLTANRLVNERSFPISWEEQRARLGV